MPNAERQGWTSLEDFKGRYPAITPDFYGMGPTANLRTSLQLYLKHVPVVAECQIPYLFGRRIQDPLRKQLVRDQVVQVTNDGKIGRVLWRFGFTPAETRIPSSYMDEGWHPTVGPLAFLTLFRPGDSLLLGEHFIAWAQTLGILDPSRLPMQWMAEEGGTGGGMLLRSLDYGREEWVFVMQHDRVNLAEQMEVLLGDIGDLIAAKIDRGETLPSVRVLLAYGGSGGTPGSARYKLGIQKCLELFRRGYLIRGLSGVAGARLGRVNPSLGMIVGVGDRKIIEWRVWVDASNPVLAVTPRVPEWANEFTRKRGAQAARIDEITTQVEKAKENNKKNRKPIDSTPEIPR